MESRNSKLIADGRAWKVDGRAQALVGPGLATPLAIHCSYSQLYIISNYAPIFIYIQLYI